MVKVELQNKDLFKAIQQVVKTVLKTDKFDQKDIFEEVFKKIKNPLINEDILHDAYFLSVFYKLGKTDNWHYKHAEDDFIAFFVELFAELGMKKMECYRHAGILFGRSAGSIQQRIVIMNKENRLDSPFVASTLHYIKLAIMKEEDRIVAEKEKEDNLFKQKLDEIFAQFNKKKTSIPQEQLDDIEEFNKSVGEQRIEPICNPQHKGKEYVVYEDGTTK